MAISHNCVIWSYFGDGGLYIPYSPEISEQIEAEYARGTLNHAIHGTEYIVCFKTMIQSRTTTGKKRLVQRIPILISSTKTMAIWEWEESPHKFVPYGIHASLDIETAYSNKQTTIDLSTTPAHIPYIIDMVTMCQTRHSFGTTRQIQRVPLPRPLHTFLKDHTSLATPIHSSSITTRSTTRSKTKKARTTTAGTTSITSVSSSLGKVSVPMTGSPYSTGTTSFSSPATAMINKTKSGGSISTKTKPVGKNPYKSAAVVTSPLKSPKLKGKPKKATTSKIKPKKTEEDEMFSKFVKRIAVLNFGEDGPCPICMSELSEPSGFEDDVGSSTPPTTDLYKLKRCGHMLHCACLIMYMKNNDKSGLTCPTCKTIHGIKTGDMPNGTMTHRIQPYSVPGHTGYNTIEITYNFTPGIHNGRHYSTNGFPRICYVPASPKGQKVFKLLQVAWRRHLTFTIGTSVTTGAANTVVWNEIHHKTEANGNNSGHGYPDDNYLDNVLAELAAQGVEEDSDVDNNNNTDSDDEDL